MHFQVMSLGKKNIVIEDKHLWERFIEFYFELGLNYEHGALLYTWFLYK